MSVLLTFDSTDFPDQKATDLSINISPPIKLPNLNYEAGLIRVNTYYSTHNITAERGNNILTFSADGGSTWETITISDGIYSLESLNTVIGYRLTVLGYNKDDIVLQPEDGVYSSGKTQFILQTGFQIDMSASNNFRLLLGWNASVITSSSTSPNFGNVNLGVHTWQIRSDLIEGSYTSGVQEDILFTFTPNKPPNSNLDIEPRNPLFLQIRENQINRIYLKLTDQDGNVLKLADGDAIIYTILIKEM
jgi:uncharacterized membrane protein